MRGLYAIHLVLMILAFLIFAANFTMGFVFLIQERQLKSHRPTGLFQKMLALETMHSLHFKLLTSGFVLLSLGMIVGSLLSKQKIGSFFSLDPKQIGAMVTWGLYALFLNIRLQPAWRGRRGILLSMLGFVGIFLTFLLSLEHRV